MLSAPVDDRDEFADDVLERLMRSNWDYQREHGHYIVPLARLLLDTRARYLTALRMIVEERELRGASHTILDAEIRALSGDAPAPPEEKLVRDGYEHLPHRVAQPGEKWGLLSAKLEEEYAEVCSANIGTPGLIEELADLVEVCFTIGGRDEVERVRLAKRDGLGGFDKMLVMKLSDVDVPILGIATEGGTMSLTDFVSEGAHVCLDGATRAGTHDDCQVCRP